MKNAFAKLLKMNPTQSSHVVFGPGGNDIPILTRNPSQSTAGYQTMGLPGGNAPFPGGGANRTVLGPARTGDNEGNAPGSVIFANDIFNVPGQPGRSYPTRTFESVGNNVFQPESDDKATYALLKRLGDQKFKAETKAPFEDYLAQQRLARDVDEASRNAPLSDLGASREIMRNMAEQRRQQNEDDYLRRMLDAGMTAEGARQEIENVRNANALQEAKRVEDRPYQAKLLINKIAQSRGVTSTVREPLTQSAAIENPDRSQAMAQAMGVAGGFGTAPLDANRQFMTPEFYRKFLRRSALTQESADEQTAFNTLLANNEVMSPPTGSYSMATLKAQEREAEIETRSNAVAARLENLRQRATRIKLPLPNIVIFSDTLKEVYGTKKTGNLVLYSPETIEDLKPLQILIALNLLVQSTSNGFDKIKRLMDLEDFGNPDRPSRDLFVKLRTIALQLNLDSQEIRIPFASALTFVDTKKVVDEIDRIKSGAPALKNEVEKGRRLYIQFIGESEPIRPEDVESLPGTGSRRSSISAITGTDSYIDSDAGTGAGSRGSVIGPAPRPAGPSSLFAELNPLAGPSRSDLARRRKMEMSANELGLSQVNFGPLQPPPREMKYGASYGQPERQRTPAQALSEAFDTRLAARDVLSGGRMSQTGKRRTPYLDAIKEAKANIKGGLVPEKEATGLNFPIVQIKPPPAIPTRTALGKMGAGEVEALMTELGYPRQSGKKKNVEYINARRK
jgi:hypothetical protein